MQEATEHCPYLEIVGEPLRPELKFTHAFENVTELIVLGEKFGVVQKTWKKESFALQQVINNIIV